MDVKIMNDDILSSCSIYLLPGRLDQLVILTPEEWTYSFKLIEKRVSFLLAASNTSVISELTNLALTLIYPKTLKSLVDYCLGSQIDESSRRTLSGLFILFSRAAIELNKSQTSRLSSNLISISKDLSLIQKNHD